MKTACLLALGVAIAADAADPSFPRQPELETVRTRIESAAASPHPRLLASAELLAGLRDLHATDTTAGKLARRVVNQAEAYLDLPPIERTLVGRRLLGQSRRVVKRVVSLATAYHITGETRFVERCEEEMLAAAGFEDWNPSHFLDVGEMAMALAIGYDWLYSELAPSSRESIRSALLEKAILLPFTTRHRGWVTAQNNWGQVCHGGLTAAALAILEHEPEWATKTVHQAVHHLPRSMAAFAPRGSYPEGPGYWSYGTTYNVLLLAVLESALNTDFGLSGAPGFSDTGAYLNLVTGPSGRTFNYADGGDGRGPEPALYWLARRYQRPDWTISEPGLLDKISGTYRHRFLPLALLWMDDSAASPSIRMPLHWSSEGDVPITLHRSSWTHPNATFVGLKGGSPSANHGQMDTGSFVLDARGIRWALDLGAEGYHGIESRGMNLWDRGQESDRWTIFRQQNLGHNTLVIDGRPQWVRGSGEFIDFSDQPDAPYSVLDLSGVYKDQAGSVQRGVRMALSGEVLIRDELRGLRPGCQVRWGMITEAEATADEPTHFVLSRDGERLQLELLAPTASAWQIVDTATPRAEWDSPNRGTRMVAFEATAPENGALDLVVRMTPGDRPRGAGSFDTELPLGQWGDTAEN